MIGSPSIEGNNKNPAPNHGAHSEIPVGVWRQIAREFQIGAGGVSYDYRNNFLALLKWCKSFIGVPGFNREMLGWDDEEFKNKILGAIQDMPTYREYANLVGPINNVKISDFVSSFEKNPLVNKLDANVKRVKEIAVSQLSEETILEIIKVIEQSDFLIKNQEAVK